MLDSRNLHHAYIIQGEREAVLDELKKFLEKDLRFATRGNPDFYLAEYDKFGVDEAREIVEKQQQKAFGGERKVFALAANSITREAQNSLLKIFEEPTEGTHFFVILPSVDRILPTLQSRAVVLRAGRGVAGFGRRASEFLKLKPAQRLELVKGMLDDLKDEKITKLNFLNFFNEIERIKSAEISAEISAPARANLENLLKMRSYLQDQSSSAKLILEYLALTL